MNHIIEHALDSIGLLAECRRILKAEGKLVVVTPNIKSLGRSVFGKAWLHWDPPRHLFLFSPKSLRACAERAGVGIEDLRTTAKSARWMWAASRLIKRNGWLPEGSPQRQGLQLKLEGLAFWAIEYALNYFLPLGEELVLEATK